MNTTLSSSSLPYPNSTFDPKDMEWTLQSLTVGLLGILLSLVTVSENAAILFVIIRTPSLRTSSNFLICSLAIADLVIGAVSMNVYTLYSMLGSFPFGEQLCRLYIWVDFTVWSASLSSLAMIMLDRYLSLQINTRYNAPTNHSGVIALMLFYIWGFSGIVWVWGVVQFDPEPNQCYFLPSQGSLHMLVSALTTVYSPLILITTLSYAISRVVRSHSARAKNRIRLSMGSNSLHKPTSSGMLQSTTNCTYKRAETSTAAKKRWEADMKRDRSPSTILGLTCQRILNREKKALRLLVAFVITFYLCISPYYVTYIILAAKPEACPEWLLTFSYWAGYFNSTVNPLLYNTFNEDFRKAFQSAFHFGKTGAGNAKLPDRDHMQHSRHRGTAAGCGFSTRQPTYAKKTERKTTEDVRGKSSSFLAVPGSTHMQTVQPHLTAAVHKKSFPVVICSNI